MYLVCPQELKKCIDVIFGDAVHYFSFVSDELHYHLGNIQTYPTLHTWKNQSRCNDVKQIW